MAFNPSIRLLPFFRLLELTDLQFIQKFKCYLNFVGKSQFFPDTDMLQNSEATDTSAFAFGDVSDSDNDVQEEENPHG